jgi:tetratricopeptide (TPR) repeat protein
LLHELGSDTPNFLQGRIDALLKTAPPPGPPSVPPSAEAVRIRKEAAELYEQLIDLCADDTRTRIKAMNDLGTCLTAAGDMPEAITSFEKAIEAAVSESLPALQCKALMGMSFATARSGSLMKGVELMREAIEVTGKLHEDGPEGRAEMELIALGHLSVLTVMSKQFDDAKEVVARLCAAGKAKSDRMGKATSEELLAQRVRSRLYFELGDRAVAAEAARAVLRLANGCAPPRFIVWVTSTKGSVAAFVRCARLWSPARARSQG